MKIYKIIFLIFLVVSACTPSTEEQVTSTPIAVTATSARTDTPTATSTPTATIPPTVPFTPTIELSPTATATPTFAFPTVTVNKQAHCRYGPSVAYLHAADLYPGDAGSVRGRYIYSNWLYVKFDKLDYFCWVAPSVVDVVGNVSTVAYKELKSKGAFLLPGFAKFVVINKPATKERAGINPFTKEPAVFKARPARKIIRARPVKAAKDAV